MLTPFDHLPLLRIAYLFTLSQPMLPIGKNPGGMPMSLIGVMYPFPEGPAMPQSGSFTNHTICLDVKSLTEMC